MKETDIVHPSQRIHVLDAVRGFALLGILLMNIPYFGMPEMVVSNLNIRNEYTGLNYYTWWIVNLLFEGSMRGLFSIMFGASMMLLTTRLAAKSDIDSVAEIYYRRMIWLLLFGFINAFVFMWPGDILYCYAICGLFLFPFRSMRPKYILLIAGILMVLFTFKITYQDREPLRIRKEALLVQKTDTTKTRLTEGQKEILVKWKGFQEKQKLSNKKKEAEKEARKVKGSFKTFYSYYTDINVLLQTTIFYQINFLDCLIFILIGIAFYKLKIITGERSMPFYFWMALTGYIVAFSLSWWRLNLLISVKFDLLQYLEKIPFDMYEIRRLGLTVGHLGLLMVLYQSGAVKFLFRVWAKVGQMAFSNYLLQSIICSLFFYGFAFNKFNELERYELYLVVAAVWTFNVAFSYLWLHFFTMGPFEWLWRSLTYWRIQPIRKHKE